MIPTAGQLSTGVTRRVADRGGVSSQELSGILDALADDSQLRGLPRTRAVVRPSGATFLAPDGDGGCFAPSSAMQLTRPQESDTTDRRLVDRARRPTNAAFSAAARPLDLAAIAPDGAGRGAGGADGGVDGGSGGGGGGSGSGGDGGGGGGGHIPGGFDAAGFGDARGLMKDLFYWSPFMTCAACNTLTVIDASNARAFAAVRRARSPTPLSPPPAHPHRH